MHTQEVDLHHHLPAGGGVGGVGGGWGGGGGRGRGDRERNYKEGQKKWSSYVRTAFVYSRFG